MTDFGAPELLAVAKTRFGESALRDRMRGSVSDANGQDLELLRIALSVVGRVQAAVSSSVGWPIPGKWPEGSIDEEGNDIEGQLYRERWPYDLLQRSLDLFRWRSYSGMDTISAQATSVGKGAERYFDELQRGIIALNVGVDTDLFATETLVARNRDGSSNFQATIPDTQNVLDTFRGNGWDWYRGGWQNWSW